MRVLIFIAALALGIALIAYSYVGAFAEIGLQLEAADNPVAAFFMMLSVIEQVASGDIPRLTKFLYSGLLVCVMAIVYLIGGRRKA